MNFKIQRPTIAVTGSAGKTTTKAFIASILRTRWITFESSDYWNRTDHTEQHLEQISLIHRALVLEYGMAYPGVITRHCEIIKPNIAVITNVGKAHIGNFEDGIDGIAQAKSELIKGMNPAGILFINKDDEGSKLLQVNGFKGKLVTIGMKPGADYLATAVQQTDRGLSFKVVISGKEQNFSTPVIGEYNLYNSLFAIGVADQLGFSVSEIQEGLTSVKRPKNRLDMITFNHDIKLIDDTVHAFPDAMRAAIDTLSEIKGEKTIAVLGSMPGLGESHESEHKAIGRYLKNKRIDYLLTYGNISENITVGALEAGFNPKKVNHYSRTSVKKLHEDLIKLIEPGSTILIKGASGLKMFETVRFLVDYYSNQKS
ncbi:UDP-N-acetylmuramoyl-tripeptide--D-alanyl-D-alanine ligase [Bacillaceae bacterium IKA-2]|nr:UDP-N-acetylmuramoyl-tripeptide--D-alanyl-D-alanine ligase [Bacillaceae bacterium IKA-2]